MVNITGIIKSTYLRKGGQHGRNKWSTSPERVVKMDRIIQSIEHIVSEAFGNKDYVMKRGTVCDECNNRFSSFEGKAVTQSIFVMERARMGIPTKKGLPASGGLAGLRISGDQNFTKNLINMEGLTPEKVQNIDPAKRTFQVVIPTFDGTEVPSSKLLLKMALESLYTSQRKIYDKYDFSELKSFLLNSTSSDWPFMTTDAEPAPFINIPTFTDKYKLKIIRCSLEFREVSEKVLLFRFIYGAVPMVINLLDNKGVLWMKEYLDADSQATIYPQHFKTKLEKRLAKQALKPGSIENEGQVAAQETSTSVEGFSATDEEQIKTDK